jgi:hypothetical protein
MSTPRQLCLASLFLAVFLASCFSQTPATFKTQTYTERLSSSPRGVDVNNDGILDLIQFLPSTATSRANSTVSFTVRVANGDGSFRNPVVYTFSSSQQVPHTLITSMVSGDFNGDGKVDLILDPDGGNRLRLFLGNGDGTFQTPKLVTVALPAGQQLGAVFAAADFNNDGKLDLVAQTSPVDPTSGTTGGLSLLPGDGAGNFGNPVVIYVSPANHLIDSSSLAAGNFDGDSRADVAFLDDFDCDKGNCYSALHILYNNGGSHFTDKASSPTFAGPFFFLAGDLNSDGRTDIFGVSGLENDGLTLLYGQPDRSFHAYTIAIPAQITKVYMGDFNGDTRMDLVGAPSGAGTNEQLLFFLAEADEGTFTEQYGALPTLGGVNGLVVGDFNSDTKPDVLAVMAYTTTASVIADDLNTTAGGNWGGCAFPRAGEGIRICAPSGSAASPVSFRASADSFGQLRKMELWVDGNKVAEQHHTWGPYAWFNFSDTLASGSHRGVMFATGIDNRLQASVFNFTVGACSAPSSAGVHICAPTSGSNVSSPVQVQAAATITGTLSNMQLWIDGVKQYTTASKTLNTSVSLAAGTHRFAVVATNPSGQKWESAVSATVK